MTKSKGHIYFAIKTDTEEFGLNKINNYLSIQPTRFQKINQNGNTPKCNIWEYSTPELIDPILGEEIDKLIDDLIPFQDELKRLKNENQEVNFILEIVLKHGESSPALYFSKKSLDFLNFVDSEIDCDIYNIK